MQDMTLELFSNNQSFGNSFTKTRHVASNSALGVAEPISTQGESDTDEGDNPVLFQEILGQHIAGITVPNAANMQEPNNTPLKLDVTGKSSEKTQEALPTIITGQLPDAAQAADAGGFNTGNSPSFDVNNVKVVNENQFFKPVSGNANTPLSPNLPVYQGNNRFGNSVGLDILQGMQLIPEDNQDGFSPSLDTLLPLQNKSPKDITTESGLKVFFPKGVGSGQTVEKAVFGKTQQRPSGILGNNLGEDVSIINAQSGGGIAEELPGTAQLSTESVLSKNTTHIPAPVAKDLANDSGKNTDNLMSKINGNVISGLDVAQKSQTGEDGNSFDGNSQNQDVFESKLFETLMQKISSGAPFALDTQMINEPLQSGITDMQHNAQALSGIGTTEAPSSVEGQKDNVSHLLHESSNPGTENLHSAIMDQISQKMHLATHGGRSEIRINLTPPELGSLRIHFTEENDEIEAKIFVENAEVKAAIEQNTRHLKETVASHGVEIHKLEVFVQNDNTREQKSPEYFSANGNSQDNASRQERQGGNLFGDEKPTNINDLQTLTHTNTSDMMIDYIL